MAKKQQFMVMVGGIGTFDTFDNKNQAVSLIESLPDDLACEIREIWLDEKKISDIKNEASKRALSAEPK